MCSLLSKCGHDVYFSYANTDSQNTFGVTGFSNNFYPLLTISANIYNALVGVAEFQNGPGTATMETYFKYDSSGNLVEQKQIHNVAGQPAAWLLTGYTYDGAGNVLGINNENYGYDSLDRITSSSYTRGWGDITYTYDGAGNRLTMTKGGATTTYTTASSTG